MENVEKLSPSAFARRVGVNPSRITVLKSKLNKTIYGERTWLVHVDKDNLRLFKNTKLESFGKVTTSEDGDSLHISILDINGLTIQKQINIMSIIKSTYSQKYPIMSSSSGMGNRVSLHLKKK